jgi:hypothetical protein
MVVVVVIADTAGVTSIVEVVVDVVGEGMTTPDGGKETTPNDELRVGPLGWLWGTKMIAKIPRLIKAREMAHHTFCGNSFFFCDSTPPILKGDHHASKYAADRHRFLRRLRSDTSKAVFQQNRQENKRFGLGSHLEGSPCWNHGFEDIFTVI